MELNLDSRDFSSTKIKTASEKMRAIAIITAQDDTIGLSKINFSLTSLLQSSSHQDIFFILGQWATEPIRRSPRKYLRFPAAGKEALTNRANALMDFLQARPDISDAFIHSAKTFIFHTIDKEIMHVSSHKAISKQKA